MAKSPTVLFDTLTKKANLSNPVSQEALAQANAIWDNYKDTPNALRNPQDLAGILAKLDIVLNQVAYKLTRIEPTQWHGFCQLHTLIATALRTGKPLEPCDKPVKRCQALAISLTKALNTTHKAVA